MASRIPAHIACNVLCAGDEHADVEWHEWGDERARAMIVAQWRAVQERYGVEVLDVRRVEAGPPTDADAARMPWSTATRAQWPRLIPWGIRWREVPA